MQMPKYGWKARGDRLPTEKREPFRCPRVGQMVQVIPFLVRLVLYWLRRFRRRNHLFINNFNPLQHQPFYGVPCGTIGSGGIGRDFRGGFCKFSLRPGMVEQHVSNVPADQFIVTIRKGGTTVYQKVLSAARPTLRSGELSAWDFGFDPRDLHYTGLFPRSWTKFEIKEHGVILLCRQVSPVIPHNYKDSSLPVSVFEWQIQNEGDESLFVNLTFTFRNGTGESKWSQESSCESCEFDRQSEVSGVSLRHAIDGMQCTYGLATKSNSSQTITRCLRFNPSSSGRRLWEQLGSTGNLESQAMDPPRSESLVAIIIVFIKRLLHWLLGWENTDDLSISRELGVALSVQCSVSPGTTECVPFVLAWDMPTVTFGGKRRKYARRYTRFFGDRGDAGPELCSYALEMYSKWEQEIDLWQNPVVSHPSLPAWYKSALFNELYFITDGGSVWMEFDKNWPVDEAQMTEKMTSVASDYGRFAYLESWEYRMLNTYDVHFYASFALAQLWPHLEHSFQADFADQVFHSVSLSAQFIVDGDVGPVKMNARLPHDMGNPADDPWLRTNAYRMHDTAQWRDLNLKFVLLTYRDYLHVVPADDGKQFLSNLWPAVQVVMSEALEHWDDDNDGLICNSGRADQTYDAWCMFGVSAYCGCLWLCSLRAAQQIALIIGDESKAAFYAQTLEKARVRYEDKLWTGAYYTFDEGSPTSKDVIMADQLCGLWFLDATNRKVATDILPEDRVLKALGTIHKMNFAGFCDGKMGVVNGMHPDGVADVSCIQSEEVWTGVCYSLAAFLCAKGLAVEGFQVAGAVYDACYERFGLQYQTPEAIFDNKCYRAIGYMRPLSIWAMQWALEKQCNFPNLDFKLN